MGILPAADPWFFFSGTLTIIPGGPRIPTMPSSPWGMQRGRDGKEESQTHQPPCWEWGRQNSLFPQDLSNPFILHQDLVPGVFMDWDERAVLEVGVHPTGSAFNPQELPKFQKTEAKFRSPIRSRGNLKSWDLEVRKAETYSIVSFG